MKRTLTVVLTAAAFLAPAGAASAAPSPHHVDASCNNGSGGNDKGGFNNRGKMAGVGSACLPDRPGDGGDGGNGGGITM